MNTRTTVTILLLTILYTSFKTPNVDAQPVDLPTKAGGNGKNGTPKDNGPKAKENRCQDPVKIYESFMQRTRKDAPKYALAPMAMESLNDLKPYFKEEQSLLGEGSFAQAFEVKTNFDKQPYAMKVGVHMEELRQIALDELPSPQASRPSSISKSLKAPPTTHTSNGPSTSKQSTLAPQAKPAPKAPSFPIIQSLAYEANIMLQLLKLNSIYFPKLIAYGRYEGNEAIVMELLFKSLNDVYTETYELNGEDVPQEAVTILVLFMMEALAELHKENLLHRDTKLENLLFGKRMVSGKPVLRLVLCDFGTTVEDKPDVPYHDTICGPYDLLPSWITYTRKHTKRTEMLTIMNAGFLMLSGLKMGPDEISEKAKFEKTIKESKSAPVIAQFDSERIEVEQPMRQCYIDLLDLADNVDTKPVVNKCMSLLRGTRTEEEMQQTLIRSFPVLKDL